MARMKSTGTCGICEKTFSKGSMTTHLKSCRKKNAKGEAPSNDRDASKTRILHLLVEGRYLPEYWMHLEMPAGATLDDLDSFLRYTWLECCNHISAFTIENQTYSSYPSSEFDDKDMGIALGDVLQPGMRLAHEYDFGSTTHLALRVVGERTGEFGDDLVRILSRNDPPPITCDDCAKTATQVCTECLWSGKGWLCDACANGHECGEDMLLPAVNSPRVGVCGYDG